ncbi:hypothetical protein NKJ09_22945 [Mesorhizobium sp. M0189]|uniref:hypothetical protein n=1 Tax=Mesorhizobium sp. M0189 TaxID=2956909 RepID=UPI00333A958D
MKKSTLYFRGFLFFMTIAVIGMFAGAPDARIASGLVIGWVCFAASDILEALGK